MSQKSVYDHCGGFESKRRSREDHDRFYLAKGLAVRGQRVLVIDNDPQGNLTHALLADPEALTAEILSYYKPDAVNALPQPVARNLFLLGVFRSASRAAWRPRKRAVASWDVSQGSGRSPAASPRR
jgi:hypothetical protein